MLDYNDNSLALPRWFTFRALPTYWSPLWQISTHAQSWQTFLQMNPSCRSKRWIIFMQYISINNSMCRANFKHTTWQFREGEKGSSRLIKFLGRMPLETSQMLFEHYFSSWYFCFSSEPAMLLPIHCGELGANTVEAENNKYMPGDVQVTSTPPPP